MFENQNNGMTQAPQKRTLAGLARSIPNFVWLVVAVLVITIASYYVAYYFSPLRESDLVKKSFLDGLASRERGDFESSNAYFEYVAENADNPDMRANAE